MAVCPNGHPVPEANRFCNQCGATMALPLVPPAAAEPTSVAGITNAMWETPPQLEPRNRSNTAVYVIAALVIVLALGGAAAVLLLNSGGDSKSSPPVTTPSLAPLTPSSTPTTAFEVRIDGVCGDASSSRPTSMVLACGDGTQVLEDIVWDSWTMTGATGRGIYNLQSNAHNVHINAPATVTLALPTSVSDSTIFTQLTITASGYPANVWTYSAMGWNNQNWAVDVGAPVARGPLASEASACPGNLAGNRPFGHIGDPAASSCGFIRNTFRAYQADPAGGPYTVRSPATKKSYNNVTCTPNEGWVYCQGGRPDANGDPSAKMYFAQQ